jgi:hypothetical protein
MVSSLQWEAGPLSGLVLAFRTDDVLGGRVRRCSVNAWEAHYEPAGFERPVVGLVGVEAADDRRLVASRVSLHEARRAVERRHETLET